MQMPFGYVVVDSAELRSQPRGMGGTGTVRRQHHANMLVELCQLQHAQYAPLPEDDMRVVEGVWPLNPNRMSKLEHQTRCHPSHPCMCHGAKLCPTAAAEARDAHAQPSKLESSVVSRNDHPIRGCMDLQAQVVC